MTPFFSIIIPVYNVAQYLCECLDSVFAQTFTEWEAICVDDGSTDGCGAILDEYKAKDERFHIIHQNNAGVGAARNAALDVAKGEWVLFLDADDAICDKALESVCAAIVSYPSVDLIRFGLGKFVGRKEIVPSVCIKDFRSEEAALQISWAQYYVFFTQYAYKKRLIGSLRFHQLIRGEDILFMGICLDKCKALVSTSALLYYYRLREGSAIRSRMTYRALHDEVAYRVMWFDYMKSSKKVIDSQILRLHELFIMEHAPLVATSLSRDEFVRFRKIWYGFIAKMYELGFFSFSSNALIWICLHVRSELCFHLLCDWRVRIKNRIRRFFRESSV